MTSRAFIYIFISNTLKKLGLRCVEWLKDELEWKQAWPYLRYISAFNSRDVKKSERVRIAGPRMEV
jgi:hypothetical protein